MQPVQLYTKLSSDEPTSSKTAESERNGRILAGAHWISCSHGEFPNGAVLSSCSSNYICVARAQAESSASQVIPGFFWWNYKRTYISQGRHAHKVNPYEILAAPRGSLLWIPSSGGELVEDAVIGGKAENGETLLIARRKPGEMYGTRGAAGKIHPSKKKAYFPIVRERFPWPTFEWAYQSYEILVAAPKNGNLPSTSGASIVETLSKNTADSSCGIFSSLCKKVNAVWFVLKDRVEFLCSRTFLRYYLEPWYITWDIWAPWKLLLLWASWMAFGGRYWFLFWLGALHTYWVVIAVIIYNV